MFAYCNNNPVMYVDVTGESIAVAIVAGILAVALTILLTSCENSTTSSPEIVETTGENDKIVEDYPWLKYGRYEDPNEMFDALVEEMTERANTHHEELGYIIYSYYGGYYYSMPIGNTRSTNHSVDIRYGSIPDGAQVLATAHTHLHHNEELLYISHELQGRIYPSIVVDGCGCAYILYPDAYDYTDYHKIR